jgi:hypothetical protein
MMHVASSHSEHITSAKEAYYIQSKRETSCALGIIAKEVYYTPQKRPTIPHKRDLLYPTKEVYYTPQKRPTTQAALGGSAAPLAPPLALFARARACALSLKYRNMEHAALVTGGALHLRSLPEIQKSKWPSIFAK